MVENGIIQELKPYDKTLKSWVKNEKAAIKLISYLSKLLYKYSVELVLFRNALIGANIQEVIYFHDYAKNVAHKPISIFDTLSLAKEIFKMGGLAPSKIDIGKLAYEWDQEKDTFKDQRTFLQNKLGKFLLKDNNGLHPRDVVLYGFGRIGRLAARELVKQAGKGQQLRLRAIVTRKCGEKELKKRVNLLRMDSVHGPISGIIETDIVNNTITFNGQLIHMIEAASPDNIDYTIFGIDDAIIIDNTGAFRDKEALSLHLKSKGASKVILTAPGKGIPNIVYGVNNKTIDIEKENIFSAASCTTNAIVPVLKVIEDNLGIEKGHIETVHAYTNDQNLLDNMHSKHRRGRSAAVNMVITETGAASAAVKAIPSLEGKLTANAVRVPTPNGSLAIMNLTVSKKTDLKSINTLMQNASLTGDLVNQIRYSVEEDLVSNDIIGNVCCSVFDSPATLIHPDGNSIVLYVWYDNEFGYTKQVIRFAKQIAKVRRLLYY
ncbi:MAG TPA: glyceraldehyde-3-phosphate dehydrogenase [Bacteroidetes bacterium]|nr:glyceraldehyde-3-phosphate dehydrogenase [Bacteroidota bacterium]